MIWLAAAGTSLIGSFATWLYSPWTYPESRSRGSAIPKDKKEFWLFAGVLFCMLIAAVGLTFIYKNPVDFSREMCLLIVLVNVSIIDGKHHIIPNRLVLCLLAVRFLFCALEFLERRSIGDLISYGLGFLLSGVFLLIAMLISKGNIGAGDVKLFAVVGFFVGIELLPSFILLTFFTLAVLSIFLLIIKKATLKTTVPMAPFVLLGVLLNYLNTGG